LQQLAAAMASCCPTAAAAERQRKQRGMSDLEMHGVGVPVQRLPPPLAAAAQSRFLRVINSTATPVRLELLDAAAAPADCGRLTGAGSDSAGSDLAQVIQVPRRQLLIAPDRDHSLEILAAPCSAAGKASAAFLLAAPSSQTCTPVSVTVEAEYQDVSVSVDCTEVDFAVVPTYKPTVKHLLRVSNNTGVALALRAMVSAPQGISSKFSVEPSRCTLQPYESSYPMALMLHPGRSSEVIKGAKLLIAAGSASCISEVGITAVVQQPKVQLKLADTGQAISPNEVVPVPPLQPCQQQQLNLKVENQGEERVPLQKSSCCLER